MSIGMRPANGMPQRLRGLGDLVWDEFFHYILTVSFVGSDNQQLTLPIQSDAHFIAVSSYMNSSLAVGAGTFMGACVNRGGSVVQLKDISSGRDLSNAQEPASTLFGTAQRPYVWTLRRLFRANGGIQFNVTDTTGAAQVVDYVIGGFKVPLDSPSVAALTRSLQ